MSRSYKESDVRRLCAESMNNCMFSGCTVRLTMENTFIGEICHIEAESPGGPRYNPNMTKDEREGYDNLILLCRNHHRVIDSNVQKYTVDILQQMKDEHIQNGNWIPTINNRLIIPCEISDAIAFSKYCFGVPGTSEEIDSVKEILSKCLNNLKHVPVHSRRVFCQFLERAYESDFSGFIADPYEFNSVLGCSKAEFLAEVGILARYKLVSEVDPDYEVGKEVCWIQGDSEFPTIWIDIREYCKANGIKIEQVVVDLDFSVFDEEME